jgi:hypothetical protein
VVLVVLELLLLYLVLLLLMLVVVVEILRVVLLRPAVLGAVRLALLATPVLNLMLQLLTQAVEVGAPVVQTAAQALTV